MDEDSVHKLSATLFHSTIERKYQQVTGPAAATESTDTIFGSQLTDNGLADKGKAAFKELFEITDDEDKKAFAKVVNYFDEYISIVFMKNVHSGVLTTAQIYDFATIVDINGFFEANKPEELGFNKTHRDCLPLG
ncbi:hypothetical protein JCM33374_g6637 [Metschnikowia sp. JCM 33374]|nr:hypothetical protein JCM33374_g6637 [Metschnikowia sp. JCM 33374]